MSDHIRKFFNNIMLCHLNCILNVILNLRFIVCCLISKYHIPNESELAEGRSMHVSFLFISFDYSTCMRIFNERYMFKLLAILSFLPPLLKDSHSILPQILK